MVRLALSHFYFLFFMECKSQFPLKFLFQSFSDVNNSEEFSSFSVSVGQTNLTPLNMKQLIQSNQKGALKLTLTKQMLK